MAKKNVGKIEGYVRLTIAAMIVISIFMQPTFGLWESIGAIVAFCLTYNFFYSHCYGWQWMGISTYREPESCPLDEA